MVTKDDPCEVHGEILEGILSSRSEGSAFSCSPDNIAGHKKAGPLRRSARQLPSWSVVPGSDVALPRCGFVLLRVSWRPVTAVTDKRDVSGENKVKPSHCAGGAIVCQKTIATFWNF
jgi:hypothetical protein